MNIEIIEAIFSQNTIEIVYKNEIAIVEPYCYGITATGNEGLIAYQIKSQLPKAPKGWRIFELDKADDINVLTTTYTTIREHAKIGYIEMDIIYAQI
jgi:hypothetical protein